MDIPPHLVNEYYNDRYFDVVNAIHEAKQVFFKGASVLDKLEQSNTLIIGETGFGSGRMLLAFFDYLLENNITHKNIIWNSVELHPITSDRMRAILGCFSSTHQLLIDTIINHYSTFNINQQGWHQSAIEHRFGNLTLRLRIGEALEMVKELPEPCDIWLLDGHGPKKNPMMWRPDLLSAIGAKTKTDGTFATYTVAGIVKRALKEAGFEIEIASGCGGKKESLRGKKR